MTTTRSCATCAAFYPDTAGAAPECWNLVSFVERPGTPDAQRRAPGPTDCCGQHLTSREDAKQTAYIDLHRDELMAGIRQHAERDQLRDAEVGAERIMQQVIVKMRKGSTS